MSSQVPNDGQLRQIVQEELARREQAPATATAAAAMTCAQCGAENAEGSKFCAQCGASLVQEEAAPAAAAPRAADPNARRFAGIGIVGRKADEQKHEPGIRLARMCRALARAKGDAGRAIAIIADRYHDRGTADLVARAMESSTPSAGGYIVPEQFSAEIIPLLRSFSVLMKAGVREIPMPTGTLHIPKVATGTSASYVGEASGGNAVKPTVGRVTMTAKKLRALAAISNDLLETSDPAADALVRDDLVAALAEKTDYAGLLGMGTDYEPKGILRQPSSIITDLTVGAAITSDTPAAFVKAALDAKVIMRTPGWIFNPTIWEDLYGLKATTGEFIYRSEMDQGRLLNIPFYVTQQIPNSSATNNPTHMVLGDWSEYLMGVTRELELAFSTEAAYNNESGTLVSAFDEDVSLIRAIVKHDFAPRQGKAFIVSDDVHTS